MGSPPSDEGREVLQPSHPATPTVPAHLVHTPETPRDHHRVRDGVRDGAGPALIKIMIQIL